MNEANDTNAATAGDLHDRLMDYALREAVGRETPPDLVERILAFEVKSTTAGPRRFSRRSLAAMLAIASSLVIAIPMLWSRQDNQYKDAMRSTSIAKAKSIRNLSRPEPGESAYLPHGSLRGASGPWESRGRGSKEAGRGNNLGRLQSVAPQEEASAVPSISSSTAQDVAASTPSTTFESGLSVVSRKRQIELERLTSKSAQSLQIDWSKVERDQRPALYKEVYGVDKSMMDLDMLAYQDAARRGTMKLGRSVGTLRDQGADDLATVGLNRDPIRQHKSSLGIGPGSPGDQYTRIHENPFTKAVGGDAVSTFSIDVDTASYANVRQFLMDLRRLPPPDAVRIEELVNYFDYDYTGPTADSDAPFAAHMEVASCPWSPEHRLVRIGVKGREIANDKRPPSNLVFLVDVSGSMDEPNKLPLVVDGLRQLTRELGENDRVAIVVYASSEGLALPSTRGDQQQAILEVLGRLQAGGSTAGGAGIQLAYQIAQDHFIPGGTNRVVLCTDGDFNVGVTSTAELERLVTEKAKDTKVFLSVLGFGRGNLNDAMMQTIADRGNGNHHYVDNLREARKVLVEEMTGTLITIAKDVKLQVEFNPAQVSAYRLLGYENRLLRTEDFNDDTKDAGEIGAGHTVTALYEVVPAGQPVNAPQADELKYQANDIPKEDAPIVAASKELLTLKMRYKQPEGDTSRKLEWSTTDAQGAFQDATDDFRFAAAVAEYGLLLRGSEFKGAANFEAVAEIASGSLGADPHGYRTEFVELVRRAAELASGR